MRNAVCILQSAIAREPIEHQRKPLISFDITRSLEVFIQNSSNDIAG